MKNCICCFIIALALILSFSSILVVRNNVNNGADNTQNVVVDYSKKTYVAFGDSITFGADGFTGTYMSQPYTALVKRDLGLKLAFNKGSSGATLCNADNSISNIILNYKGNADIISVLGGVNDFYRNYELGTIEDTSNDTIYGSLNVIANSLVGRYGDCFIFFMTPYKANKYHENLTTNSKGYTLENVADAVINVAKKHNIPYLDLYRFGNFESEMNNTGSDGLHPSQEFVINYTAPQIVNFIKANYK